jgi:t-SNARE complex subunit (syntaxin)
VEADTRLAGGELNVAQEYQRRAGRRMICLLLVMVIVITIVLLAVSYHRHSAFTVFEKPTYIAFQVLS